MWTLKKWLVAFLLLNNSTNNAAFIHPGSSALFSQTRRQTRTLHGFHNIAVYSTTNDKKEATAEESSDTSNEDAILTDVDSRVLQAMLQEDKLDLQKGDEMRKLLERGVRSKEPVRKPLTQEEEQALEEEESSEFSSSLFKAFEDTKLWKAVERNAQDFIESSKIFVSNRIERDSKLLGALGLFAFERAMLDVNRALPAAAQFTKKNILPKLGDSTSYSTNSSFMVMMPFQPSQQDQDSTESILRDMTTSQDEIKSVSEGIRAILQSGGQSSSAGSFASRRGLRSTVPAGMASSKERFAKALDRKEKTTLKRERENVAQRGGRAAFEVVDAAWELKQDLQVETNQPGYKTKALRESAAKSTMRLQEGAKRVLQAVKRDKSPQLDAVVEREERPRMDAVIEQEERVPTAPTTTTGIPSTELSQLRETFTQELANTLQRLQQCIGDPDSTWLRPELVSAADEVKTLDRTIIEPIITSMIRAEQILALKCKVILEAEEQLEQPSFTTRQWMDTLEEAKVLIGEITESASTAGSSTIAEFLDRQLIYGPDYRSEQGLPLLLKLGQLDMQVQAAISEYQGRTATVAEPGSVSFVVEAEQTGDFFASTVVYDNYFVDGEEPMDDALESFAAEVVTESKFPYEVAIPVATTTRSRSTTISSDAEWTISNDPATTATVEDTDYQQLFDSTRGVMAEIVTDDDFEDAVGTAKTSVEVDDGQEAEPQKPNAAVQVGLRSLDIVFFIVEKTVTVRKVVWYLVVL
jgi:hypothetical protein